ncbi:hypothetical protein B9Z50_16990 [Limnohabitans sp. Bal53]|jgi:hypothetical protein|nr:hypothetical protein B9Z50_16990 [Limnohabitans sp. Bal53]
MAEMDIGAASQFPLLIAAQQFHRLKLMYITMGSVLGSTRPRPQLKPTGLYETRGDSQVFIACFAK